MENFNDLICLYDLNNIIIYKDYNKNLFLKAKLDNSITKIALGDRYNECVVPADNDYVFILGDYISVINGNSTKSANDYKLYNYSSSYYYFYSGVVSRGNDIYTVNAEDGDLIVCKINENVTFKRLFDYEVTFDNIMNAFDK